MSNTKLTTGYVSNDDFQPFPTRRSSDLVRNDQPLSQTADQVALALRDEVRDLESAGIRIIQVDEPALRESLPLRIRDRKSTRLNSSHVAMSYSVFCLKKKNIAMVIATTS